MNIIRYGGPMSRTRKVGSPIGYSGSAGGAIEAFISVWATTGTFETITIPCQNIGTFNAVVDWGDSSPLETITTYNGFSHVYDDIGEHTISITGTFPNIYMNNNAADKLKIKRVLNLGTVGWTSFLGAFYGCTNLTEFTAGSTDTSAVTSMRSTFHDCIGLTSLDVSSFDTSLVTDMYAMFYNNNLSSIDVSSFNTSQVVNAQYMFRGYLAFQLTSIVGVENWNITGFNTTNGLSNFITGTGNKMTTAQYDNLLINWEAQASVIPAMTAAFGASKYTGGGAAATAHASLTDVYGWAIGDGGIA